MNIAGITSATIPSVDTPAKVASLSAADRSRAAHLSGSALRHASPAEQRAAVAAQFEAILVRQMLGKTITSMMGKAESAASNVYGDLLTETFAQQLTAGSGLGMASMIEHQLSPRAPAQSSAPTH